MKTLALGTIAASVLVLAACAAPAATDLDTASHCSAATEKYALSQAAKNATIASPEQLAQAPEWLPEPACATASPYGTVWIYPVASREDLDGILDALREQGQEVPEFTINPDFTEIVADDFYVSFVAAGQHGAPTQTIIVNAP